VRLAAPGLDPSGGKEPTRGNPGIWKGGHVYRRLWAAIPGPVTDIAGHCGNLLGIVPGPARPRL